MTARRLSCPTFVFLALCDGRVESTDSRRRPLALFSDGDAEFTLVLSVVAAELQVGVAGCSAEFTQANHY